MNNVIVVIGASSIDQAKNWLRDTASSLARAWITVALRLHGVDVLVDLSPVAGPGSPDLMVLLTKVLATTVINLAGAP